MAITTSTTSRATSEVPAFTVSVLPACLTIWCESTPSRARAQASCVGAHEGLHERIEQPRAVIAAERRVLGMMPHPERLNDPALGGDDGAGLFESLVQSLMRADA